MLRGGFLAGDTVMLAGSAGTGKTTLALQYIVNGILLNDEPGLMVSFEQLPQQIYRDAFNFGWDLRKLEEMNKLRLICTSPELLLASNGGENLLDSSLEEIAPKRIAIDSIRCMENVLEGAAMREELYRLLMFLRSKKLSSLLTWEASNSLGGFSDFVDEQLGYLTDCIILMRHIEIASAIRKVLLVLKMRGSDHDKRLIEYDISSKGISIIGPITGYENILSGSPKRVLFEDAAKGFAEAFPLHEKTK